MRTTALALLSLAAGCIQGGELRTETEELPVDAAITAVSAHIDSGTIALRRSESSTVTADLAWRGAKPELDWWIEGGTLFIEGACEASATACSIDLHIGAHVDVTGDLYTGSGLIEISGLAGDQRAETAAGDIELVELSGRIHAQSVSGSIFGSRLAVDQLFASTSSGGVSLEHLVPFSLVDAQTASGGIELVVPEALYRCVTSAGTGYVQIEGITESPDAEHVIRASTGSGSIVISGS